MDSAIIFQPYQKQTWPLFLTIPISVLAFVCAGYFLYFSLIASICFIGAGVICILLTKVVYDSSKRFLVFEQEGLRIVGSGHSDYRYMPWEVLIHGYYVRNYKGHLFLILSPNVLNVKAAKRLVWRGANSSRICIDDTVVIFLDDLQNTAQIKELISEHIADTSYL